MAAFVRLQAGRVQAGRCAGAGGLVAEALKPQGEAAEEALANSFANLVNDPAEPWPNNWIICKVALLPKAPKWDCVALLRPLMFPAILYTLFIRVWLGLAQVWIAPRENWTMGFRAGYQASDMTRTVTGLTEQAQEFSSELHVVETDLRKKRH